ncbi:MULTISPECIES: NADPH:quinone reductase [unclassified Breznakia]|nr:MULTISPECIES: NADPH:quinone reductase [unclassified Breznakia]MDF9824045.1 NADPH2:quinone reductase [Breznakia sp. PM6-1]MDF9837089.1 NADPH2:quinone reductase [Breznakia sp. PFB2-8]
MKAIVVNEFGDEHVLQYTDIPIPTPNEGQVRIKVAAIGVNPVETYIRSGHYTRLPKLPYTPGNDAAGIVDEIGSNVFHLKKGQRVYVAAILAIVNSGTYAEYVVCDADAVHPLSDTLSFSQGAAIGTPGLAAAYALYERAQIKAKEKVLIHGASGGVGSFAVQLAKQENAIVYGSAGNEEGLNYIQSLGADYTFNHHDKDYIDKIKELTDTGLNTIIEMAADKNLMKDTTILDTFGKIVVVGSRGPLEFNPRSLMSKNLQVLGMNLINTDKQTYLSLLKKINHAITLGMNILVEETLPLSQASQAHKEIIDGVKKGKIILKTI